MLLLTKTVEAFTPILVKTSHDNLVRLSLSLAPILLQAGYDKSHAKHNLWGIISPAVDYLEVYKKASVVPERIGAYPKISKEEKYQTERLKAIWKMRLKDYTLYNSGIHGASAFTLAVVDPVWYEELSHPTTLYTNVLPATLLDHLEDCCTGLHAINAVDLPLIIQGYYANYLSIPVYINMLEDAQLKSKVTEPILSDATLLATSTKAVFSLQEYPGKVRMGTQFQGQQNLAEVETFVHKFIQAPPAHLPSLG